MLIAAENLTVRIGGHEILSGVSLSLTQGEIVTLLGPNGSGKSTLIRALLGLVPAAAGKVARRPGLRIGYVPQKLTLDPTLPLTVRRFLSLPRRVSDAQACAALDRVGMDGAEPMDVSRLSGGQLQRVMLARALLAEPELLVLDEPTQGLDQPGEAAFYRLIEEVRRDTGAAVLMVSHDLHVVMAASDRVICLNGHICCQGSPRVVSAAPEYRALFGLGTQGALALYQHDHDHDHNTLHDPGHGPHGHRHPHQGVGHAHDHGHTHGHGHDHGHEHDHGHGHGHDHGIAHGHGPGKGPDQGPGHDPGRDRVEKGARHAG